jgi:PPOX class probable F420-dependent enzyme
VSFRIWLQFGSFPSKYFWEKADRRVDHGVHIDTVASLDESEVRELFEKPNYAVVTTVNPDDSLHGTVIWADLEDGAVAVNSAVGRRWPSNLQRDPRVSLVVYDQSNPYDFVEVRGEAEGTTEGADEHIDRLAKKYLGQDTYPYRQPDEQRIKFLIKPERVRHVKQ